MQALQQKVPLKKILSYKLYMWSFYTILFVNKKVIVQWSAGQLFFKFTYARKYLIFFITQLVIILDLVSKN